MKGRPFKVALFMVALKGRPFKAAMCRTLLDRGAQGKWGVGGGGRSVRSRQWKSPPVFLTMVKHSALLSMTWLVMTGLAHVEFDEGRPYYGVHGRQESEFQGKLRFGVSRENSEGRPYHLILRFPARIIALRLANQACV